MFDFIRSHQKLMQILLLILIVPPFAFWGVDGYRKMGDATDSVAKVAGASITQLEFQNAQRQQLDRYRQMLGAQFDAKMLDNDQAREGLLDQIVNQRVLLDYSVRQHVSASDQKLRETIAALPALQRDGKFDAATYEARLIGQGLTKQRFEGQMRQDLGLQALSGSVQESGLASKALMTKILGVMEEEREIQEMVFKPSDFTAKVVLGPDAVKTYYEANKKEFAVPAQVKAEMVQLNAAALTASVKVTDDEIAKYFEANQKKFVQAEERQASHILIGAEKDNKDARAKAKTKAEEVLKAVRAAPDTFADMAKKESMDPGSGQNGGDLGYFGKGAMVPPFEAAAFSMKVNDISELVETDFGFHILRLTGVKEAKGKSLAEAKTEIDAELKKVAAATKLRESIEKFQTAAETADSMKSLADQFGLPVGTTALFSKEAPIPPFVATPGQPGSNPAGSAKLLAAIFSDDAINKKRITDAVEIASGNWVAARVVEHKPATTKTLDESRASIETTLKLKESAALAKKEGETKLAEVQKTIDGVPGATWGATKTVSRLKPDTLFGEPIKAVTNAATAKLPHVLGVDLGPQGYVIVRINKIAPPAKVDEEQRKQMSQQLARLMGNAEYEGYLAGLKKDAKVEVYKQNLKKDTTAQ